MTTTCKVVGVVSAVAVGSLIYMYVKKKGVFKTATVVEVPPTTNADGSAPRKTAPSGQYPPHIWINNGKVRGWTDSQGKII